MRALCDVLADRPYPGRGCVVVRTTGGELVFGYFLTGRSNASHDRQIVVLDSGDIVVRSTAGTSDDALRHYVAAARRDPRTVVGNGDQVEVIAAAPAGGTSVADAGTPHSFEPDPPIFTSRIWLAHQAGSGRQHIGSAQRSSRPNGAPDRVTWTIEGIEPAKAY